jgi:adenine-specific DNA-methyltransferase
VLNNRTLAVLPAHDGQRVVYGARSRFDKAKLARMQLEFKQLPYELTIKSWV